MQLKFMFPHTTYTLITTINYPFIQFALLFMYLDILYYGII